MEGEKVGRKKGRKERRERLRIKAYGITMGKFFFLTSKNCSPV